MTFDPLREQFHEAMLNVYRRAKAEAKYPANDFLAMVNADGGLATAKKLINAPKESSGYAALYLKGRLDLTVEAVVLTDKRWHALFTSQELDRCRKRLTAHGYTFSS